MKRVLPASDVGAGLFGKVATSGDFISAGDYSPAVAHMSRWLEQGVGWATTQAKTDWETFDFSTPKAFLFRPDRNEQGDRVAFGLLQPSRDSVGRHFPLAVFGELALGSDLDGYPILPLIIGESMESAAAILAQAERGVDPRGLLVQLPKAVAHRLASARNDYTEWAKSTPLSAALGALFPGGWDSVAPAVLCSLHSIVKPFIGQDFPDTPLSIRLPLGTAGIAGVVFWLEFLRKTLRWKRTIPVSFWHAYADSGQLVLTLGDPSPKLLLSLWAANDLDDSHCDLTSLTSPFGELPKSIAVALANDVSVAEMMSAL